MGVAAGPNIVNDGLEIALSAINPKTLGTLPGDNDHGISDWYCFNSGNIRYSAIYPGTQIIEVDTNDNETVKVTASTPSQGTFSATSGRRYYGTKAIHLAGDGALDQQDIVPLTYAGTSFAHYWVRNSPQTYYVYALHDSTTVYFYDNNAAGGITGTATSSASLSKGQSTTFSSTSVNTWQFFSATNPVIMSVTGNNADCTIMAPASLYNYRRRNAYEITVNNSTPSNIGTYVVYDSSIPVVTVEIADGAGGDCAQGICLEYLSDTYSWGDVLSDYHITAPYANTTVNVYYWASNQWNLGESHSLNGSQTNPAVVDRDGTQGFDVDGTSISGGAANLASGATLWKWEGTQPFALTINNSADDEETMLGWMSSRSERLLSNYENSFSVKDLSKKGSRASVYGKRNISKIEENGEYFSFDGVDDYIQLPSTITLLRSSSTISAWVNIDDFTTGKSSTGRNLIRLNGSNFNNLVTFYNGGYSFESSTNSNPHEISGRTTGNVSSSSISAGSWFHFCLVFNSDIFYGYVNSVQTGSAAVANNLSFDRIGDGSGFATSYPAYMKGKIANFKVYDRALTAQEIQQNFNATRSRFGL